jgi:2-haloacid dehalogenase
VAVVLFDANGTLFGLDPIEQLLGAAGAEAFFERTLHSAASLTLTGSWAPFSEVAERALASTCAKLDLDVDQAAVLSALSDPPPAPDAAEALVSRAGLSIPVVLSCDEVRAFKPAAAPYLDARERLGDCVLVAAHAWDVAGARSAGLRAIWVDRSERRWPLAGVEPGERAASLAEAVALT